MSKLVQQTIEPEYFNKNVGLVQVSIPYDVFTRVNVTPSKNVIEKIAHEVLLKMPRFKGFRVHQIYCDNRNKIYRIGLERFASELNDFMAQNNVAVYVIPSGFILPPVIEKTDSSKGILENTIEKIGIIDNV